MADDSIKTILAKVLKSGALSSDELRELQVRVDQLEGGALAKGHHHTYSNTDVHYTHHDDKVAAIEGILDLLRS
jgi:hypothetical protein